MQKKHRYLSGYAATIFLTYFIVISNIPYQFSIVLIEFHEFKSCARYGSAPQGPFRYPGPGHVKSKTDRKKDFYRFYYIFIVIMKPEL